jgi:hypothetical protein
MTSTLKPPLSAASQKFRQSVVLYACCRRRNARRDVDWLWDLSIDMDPEDGCLHVYGVGEDGITAFTEDGIENLKQII